MAQRVMIALVLCLQPSLVLADEPTSSLDVVIQKQILDYLLNLKQTTFVFVTHNIQVARYIADQIVVIKDGMIVEKGNVETLLMLLSIPIQSHYYERKRIMRLFEAKDLTKIR